MKCLHTNVKTKNIEWCNAFVIVNINRFSKEMSRSVENIWNSSDYNHMNRNLLAVPEASSVVRI